jgi:hypothetical protein
MFLVEAPPLYISTLGKLQNIKSESSNNPLIFLKKACSVISDSRKFI